MKIIILIILFSSCSLYIYDNTDVEDQEVEAILTADQPLEIKWINLYAWMHNNIRYKNDGVFEDVQTPAETYDLRTGDCEDKSLLFAYWWLKYCDIDTTIVKQYGKESNHIYVKYENNYFMRLIGFNERPEREWKASKFLWRYK
jgi:hypothetical protein